MILHVVLGLFFVYQLIRFLKLLEFDKTSTPTLHHSNSGFIQDIIRKCPTLSAPYTPIGFWGKCGHIQTAVCAKLGRYNSPKLNENRCSIKLDNGDTITYDLYQPEAEHKYKGDYTILVCPGIASNATKAYMRTLIKYCVERGFRIAVLNHIGSLSSVKLTAPRIFTYGDTKYYAAMVDEMKLKYVDSTFLLAGYSMGGNIVVKYLGESSKHQENVLCAVSMCQGYDAIRSTLPLQSGYRRFYNYMITMNMKKILKPHWGDLFGEEKERSKFDEAKIKKATYLKDIEDGLLRHIDGHRSVEEYKDKASCCHVLHNVQTPLLLYNTKDDPLIINDVHDIPKAHCEKNPLSMFVTTEYGGHLGCYRGRWHKPDPITLIEEIIVEYFDAVIHCKTMSHDE